MSEGKIQLAGLSFEELEQWTLEQKQPRFRAKQLYGWLMKGAAFSEMTNLPAAFREVLEREAVANPVRIERCVKSKLDGTEKFLYALEDGNLIEGVLMRYHHGNTLCLSTQVGCKMGCRFCASTLDGWERNLLPSEMLDQIYAITRATGERVSNVVVMGTGEPLDNYENLLRFIRLLTDENGLHISQRNVTVSTCGLVPQMRRLAEEHLAITLALSLHAATDEKRRELMPVALKWRLDELMEACAYYFEQTGRRMTFEYALVGGVNDAMEDAERLTALAKPLSAHINLIPVNPIRERTYRQSARSQIEAFKIKLEKNGINVTIRREMGRDIDGACGQLRRRHIAEERCGLTE